MGSEKFIKDPKTLRKKLRGAMVSATLLFSFLPGTVLVSRPQLQRELRKDFNFKGGISNFKGGDF